MLTKSQAKAFFLVGTFVCAGAFVGLTIDTFNRIPHQTNQDKMTAEVVRGKHIWEKNNCMGCHTIMGEGAYYAPELTKVFERRGETFIRSMLKNPEQMFPGQRKMVNYHFSDAEITDLVEFFKWIGNVDLNGFPAKPDINTALNSDKKISQIKAPMVFSQTCVACHSLAGQGGAVGPTLDGVGERRDREYLTKWLHDPQSIKADSKMPKLALSEADIQELVEFLSQQKGAQ